jgi:hypothetical protein
MVGATELLDADESLSSVPGLDTSPSALLDSINATDPHLPASQQDATSSEYCLHLVHYWPILCCVIDSSCISPKAVVFNDF